jgi:hypothetical protein
MGVAVAGMDEAVMDSNSNDGRYAERHSFRPGFLMFFLVWEHFLRWTFAVLGHL